MRQRDRYSSFAELASDKQEGRDYKRLVEMRESRFAIIAPHGGGIEPGTSEIARAIANGEFASYCFEGMQPTGNKELHITSTCFDEPICVQLVQHFQTVIAVHGCAGKHEAVYVGGLDDNLKAQIIEALMSAGFEACDDISDHSGSHPQNICNRGISGKGLQLEITEGLRGVMFKGLRRRDRETTRPRFGSFITAVRDILLQAGREGVAT
jgi:phage replication-related protein YjqB (UPF0714/DUF867 family)